MTAPHAPVVLAMPPEPPRDSKAVVLSGYPSDLYDLELYPDWHRHTLPASTGQGGTWANRTEVLWANRPLGEQPALWGETG